MYNVHVCQFNPTLPLQQQLTLLLPGAWPCRPDLIPRDPVRWRYNHQEVFSSPGSVGLARAHSRTKTQAIEPSRQTRSSYGPLYPLGRWSPERVLHVFGRLIIELLNLTSGLPRCLGEKELPKISVDWNSVKITTL